LKRGGFEFRDSEEERGQKCKKIGNVSDHLSEKNTRP